MGVKFTAAWKTHLSGTNYSVEIIDTSFGGTSTELTTLYTPAAELEYLNSSDEPHTAFKRSRLNLHLCIENDATGTALESWLMSTLLENKEDRFQIALYKESNLFWMGNMIHDLSGFQNKAKPYQFILSANDGLGRLKDFEFEYAVDNDSDSSFSDIIWELLKKTPLYYASSASNLFSICASWYETQMQAVSGSTCPLRYTYFRNWVLTYLDKNKSRKGYTYWEVLEKICDSWNLRLIQSEGLWKFKQVNNHADDGQTYYERIYARSTGSYASNIAQPAVLAINQTARFTTQGGQWNFFEPIKRIYLKYPFLRKNMLNELGTMPYTQTLRSNIVGGTNKRLQGNTVVVINMKDTSVTTWNVLVTIKLKLGSNYLHKPVFGSTLSWTSTSTDRYSAILQFNGPGLHFINILEFLTPDIPSGSHTANEFSISVACATAGGTAITNFDAWREYGSSYLTYNTSSTVDNQDYYEYIGQNTSSTINSKDIELPDATWGEPIDPSYEGNLQVWDGAARQWSSGQWKFQKTGTGFDFNEIRVVDIMATRTKPLRRFQTSLIGADILPCSRVSYGSYIYILNGAKYDCKNEKWDGEWFAVGYSRTPYEVIQNASAQATDGGNQQLLRNIGGAAKDAQFSRQQLYALAQERIVTNTDGLLAAGTILSIPIGTIADDILKAGDKIVVINLTGQINVEFEVDTDVASTDTSISVTSQVLDEDIESGAVIAFSQKNPFIQALRFQTYPTSDPGVPGQVWCDTTESNVLKLSV